MTKPRVDFGNSHEQSRTLVSIGLTSFNAAGTIERAVQSALRQTWRPIEIVAVDDASSDGTRTMLERLASRHPELRVFTQPENGGVASTRNRILTEARGDFVAFFDDDDESVPERVALQMRRILDYEREFAQGAPVVCHTARRLIYPDGSERIAGTMGEEQGVPAPSGVAVARRVLVGTALRGAYGAAPTCSQMARLSTYRMLAGFDEKLKRSEDTDFNIRVALAGGHFVGLGDPLVVQYLTRTPDKSLAEEHRNAIKLIEKHRYSVMNDREYRFTCLWMEAKLAWLMNRNLQFAAQLALIAVRFPDLTAQRLWLAVPNFGSNFGMRRFHSHLPGRH